MTACEWEKHRSILNHDILCNQLRNELARLRSEPQSDTTVRLAMWPKRQREYILFFEATVAILNPERIIDSDLFLCWDNQTKKCFKVIVRNLYDSVEEIEKRVEELKSILLESIRIVDSFFSMPVDKRTEKSVVKIQEKLEELSFRISKLPHPHDCGN